jgi:hypothetical protein
MSVTAFSGMERALSDLERRGVDTTFAPLKMPLQGAVFFVRTTVGS